MSSSHMYFSETEYVNGQKTKQKEFKHVMIKPEIPMEFWELMHDFSMFLIVDDKHDLGRFTYYDRNDHFYRFKKSPHHPSPLHHWQIGIIGVFVAQMGAVVSKALDIRNELVKNDPVVPTKFKQIIDITPLQQQKSLPALPPHYKSQENPIYSKLTQIIDAI